MTSTVKPTTVRLDEPEKTIAQGILSGMGLSLNTYLNMALHQLANQRRIPFDIVAAPVIPNEETRRAMIMAEAKALGIIHDDAQRCLSSEEVMNFLETE